MSVAARIVTPLFVCFIGGFVDHCANFRQLVSPNGPGFKGNQKALLLPLPQRASIN